MRSSWHFAGILKELKAGWWEIISILIVGIPVGRDIFGNVLTCSIYSLKLQAIRRVEGIKWLLPSLVKGVLLSWHGFFLRKKRKQVWRVPPLLLFWMVWQEWNRRVFDNEENSVHSIKLNFSGSFVFLSWGTSSFVDFVNLIGAIWGAVAVLVFEWLTWFCCVFCSFYASCIPGCSFGTFLM